MDALRRRPSFDANLEQLSRDHRNALIWAQELLVNVQEILRATITDLPEPTLFDNAVGD